MEIEGNKPSMRGFVGTGNLYYYLSGGKDAKLYYIIDISTLTFTDHLSI